MENTYRLIHDLVKWVEKYSIEKPDQVSNLDDFLIWLNAKVFAESGHHVQGEGDDQLNMELSFLLIMQNRYFKSYAKQALGDSILSSPDGFSFLYHLNFAPSYRKMELVKMHRLEAPSGIEVLKRLLSKQLIEEFDDPDDGRARRVKITDLGRQVIAEKLPDMTQVFAQMAAEMNKSEKLHFLSALRDLNTYHEEHVKDFRLEK